MKRSTIMNERRQHLLPPHETLECSPKSTALLMVIAKAGRFGASDRYLKRKFGRWPGKSLRALLRRRLIKVNLRKGGRWIASGFVYDLLRIPLEDRPQEDLFDK